MKNISLFCVFLVFIEGVFGETVSVEERGSATLVSGLPEIKTDDVIDWRFGAEKILIARVRKQNTPATFNEALDGKFQDRLKLDGRTGDLTISNAKTTDSGDYEVTNSSNTYTKIITLRVTGGSGGGGSGSVDSGGLSSGAIAGIVIAVVVVLAGVVAGIYFGYVKNRQML